MSLRNLKTTFALLAASFGTLACNEVEVHTVRLVMPEVTMKTKLAGKEYEYPALAGFGCADPTAASFGDRLMFFRAFSAPPASTVAELEVALTVVVDTIRLGGYPRCRVSEIYSFCSEEGNSCEPLAAERKCFDLEPLTIPVTGTRQRDQVLEDGAVIFRDYLLSRLADQLVTDRALDEEVMIRMVGTTESCTELEKKGNLAFERDRLVGCSYSCPLIPAAAKGDVILDLDAVVTAWCEPAVAACASDEFNLSEVSDLESNLTTRRTSL